MRHGVPRVRGHLHRGAGRRADAVARFPFGDGAKDSKDVRITIPENLDYTGLFDDILQQYAAKSELKKVRTASMGAAFELQYAVTLKDAKQEKQFIDALRCRNGNLPIVCGRASVVHDEL